MRRAPLHAIVACVALAATTPAEARTTLQFSGAFNLGWTDNVLNAPGATRGQIFPLRPPIADFFGDVRPQLVLTTGNPRAVQSLSYTFSYTYFFRNAGANAYSNTVSWAGAFLPSKRTDLLLTISAAQSEQTTATFGVDTTTQPILVRPGRINTATILFREQLGIDAAPRWRVQQTFSVSALIPIAPRTLATNLSTDLGLTADYRWRKTAIGFIARVNHFYTLETRGNVTLPDGTIDSDGLITPSQGFFTNSAQLRWRQDFGNFWASELALGILHTVSQNGTGNRVGPAANAALRYTRPQIAASLAYSHSTQPSPLLAQLFLTDSVIASVVTPLGVGTNLSASLSASYGYSRQLLPDGTEGLRAHQVGGDITLLYTPIAGLSVYLRGQTQLQRGFVSDPTPLAGIQRNAILIGLSGFYPTAPAAVVPRSLGGSRVDGSDRVTIAEPHKPPVTDTK